MNKQSALTIIWGGQFGSEGKGQIAAYIQKTEPHDIAVRVGGPNAGHTFYVDKSNGPKKFPAIKVVVQSIPVATYLGAMGMIGAAGYVIPDLLRDELIQGYRITGQPLSLIIDPLAAVINVAHMSQEGPIKFRIGSTGEGVGAATAEKVMREPGITVRAHLPAFERWVRYPWGSRISILNTVPIINGGLRVGDKIMLEGTQGYGLSLHTGGYYPFCTSRECTPQALIAETGTNIHHLRHSLDSIMVLRTYPIRVGGNSGPLPNEITWDTLSDRTGGYVSTPEITTVTKKVRRIAEFDDELVERAIDQCGPTAIALNFVDYVWPEISKCNHPGEFPEKVNLWLLATQDRLGVPIKYVSWGPGKTSEWGGATTKWGGQ